MHRVEIRLDQKEFPDKMAQMRIWLDENRLEASTFSFNNHERAVFVRVGFYEAQAAAAFAQRFGGRPPASA